MAWIFNIFRNLRRRNQIEQDLHQEILSYVDLLALEKQKSGIGAARARREALIEAGGMEQNKEAVRDVRAGASVGHFVADVRYAVRGMRRNPGFSFVAILSIALGIGVNSTAFSSVKWLVLNPFPFPAVDRIMTVWGTTAKLAGREAVSPADFFDFARNNHSFESLAAWRGWDAALTSIGEPQNIRGQLVTPSFFRVFGTAPLAGRTFLGEDSEGGREDELVISYGFWKSRLASRPDALGQTMVINQKSYSIVGIMPEDFEYPIETEIWARLVLTPQQKAERALRSLMVIGLLNPGAKITESAAEMRIIAERLEANYPVTNESRGVRLIPLVDTANGDGVGSRFMVVLFAAALFVMLLACANLANLLLARASARRKEIGVRAALGGSRSRIARQLLTEIALLAIVGAVAGVVLGYWNQQEFKTIVPPEVIRWVPGLKRMHFDWGTIGFAFGLSLAGAFLSGLPALLQLLGRGSSTRLMETLQEGGRAGSGSRSRTRFRNAIVVAESALALLLLVGAGLMTKTFQHMLTFDKGFDASNLLTMETALPESRYQTKDQIRDFFSIVLTGIENTPGVQAAAASAGMGTRLVRIESRPEPSSNEPPVALYAVTPEYTKAMKMEVRAGRPIASYDGPDTSGVIVISGSLARRYWPDSSPLGQRVRLGKESTWLSVVGVVGDTKDWFTGQPEPRAYVAFAQWPQLQAEFFVRTQGDPLLLARDARRQVYQADPLQPVFGLDTMDHVVAIETSGLRSSAASMTIYAVIALLLAVTGIYSLSSYLATQRTSEMGLRMALGAVRGDILLLSIVQSGRLAALGLTIGLTAAFALARLMSSVLYGVVALDWKTFAEVTALLAGCVLVAMWVPAHRASRIDPVIALRHE